MASAAVLPPKLRRVEAPRIRSRYKTADSFERSTRTYQWEMGFDVESLAGGNSTRVVLGCSTHSACPFSVVAAWKTFPGGKLEGQQGFEIEPTPFERTHSHLPPYLPLDLDAENQRRSTLSLDDPSLTSPPLIPVGPFYTFLQSMNPDLLQHLDALTAIGMPHSMDMQILDEIDEDLFRTVLSGVVPPLPREEIIQGVLGAKERRKEGEEGWRGRLGTEEGERHLAEWVKQKVLEGRTSAM